MGSISEQVDFELDYSLPRGGKEEVRLAAQHHMLQSRQGWTIHPQIAEDLAKIPHPRIADVATGTGIWACEVAERMPNAEVIGLDISDQQFPPQWTWPANAALGLYDLLADVPAHLVGMFDLVHVRLLLCAGPAVDKSVFIEKFRTLLKPGGWLQWEDLEFPNVVTCKVNPTGFIVEALEDHTWMTEVQSKHLLMHEKASWVPQFAQVIENLGGWTGAARIPIPIKAHLLQLETELTLAVFTSLGEMLVQRKGSTEPGLREAVGKSLARLYLGAELGTKYSYTWNVCIARKAC